MQGSSPEPESGQMRLLLQVLPARKAGTRHVPRPYFKVQFGLSRAQNRNPSGQLHRA